MAQYDIISLHVPCIKGENDQLIDADFIAKTKGGAMLINTARGALQDNEAIIEAIKADKLYGFGGDVLPNEGEIFFHEFDSVDAIPDETVKAMVELYPRILLTPHVGSNTDEALRNMVEISYDNFNQFLTEGKVDNNTIK